MTAPTSGRAKSTTQGKIILAVIVALLVTGLVFAVRYVRSHGSEVENARIGTCLARSSDTDVAVVDCADKDAEFTVIGREENASRVSASIFPCKAADNVDSTVFVDHRGTFSGESRTGVVLCLSKKTRK
jgi:hypothetical protein